MGATSQDVHKGLGHPGSGQSSAEQHHDGQHKNKNPGRGLDGAMKGTWRLIDLDRPEDCAEPYCDGSGDW
ncbi:hypothetical protein BDW59DRAFT_56306 [Aspergillus cavernicola]|uniref:Uncharacterized protein n=1 Tax=Aspergillus cavernicola TaxID=176166 RepID=A0ABR4ILF1_9EURO